MYRTVFKKDPLDPQLGKQYRDKILGPGGSRDESDSLKVSAVHCSTPHSIHLSNVGFLGT